MPKGHHVVFLSLRFAMWVLAGLLLSPVVCTADTFQTSGTGFLFAGNDSINWQSASFTCTANGLDQASFSTVAGVGVVASLGACQGPFISATSTDLEWDQETSFTLQFAQPITGIELFLGVGECASVSGAPPYFCDYGLVAFGPSGNPIGSAYETTTAQFPNGLLSVLDQSGPGITSVEFFAGTIDEGPNYFFGVNDVNLLETPEPSSLLLLGTGLLGLGPLIRRRFARRYFKVYLR